LRMFSCLPLLNVTPTFSLNTFFLRRRFFHLSSSFSNFLFFLCLCVYICMLSNKKLRQSYLSFLNYIPTGLHVKRLSLSVRSSRSTNDQAFSLRSYLSLSQACSTKKELRWWDEPFLSYVLANKWKNTSLSMRSSRSTTNQTFAFSSHSILSQGLFSKKRITLMG
jgi:hypothetical protein